MKQILVRALAATFAFGSVPMNAKAQSRCDVIKPSRSSGLIMSITKTAIRKENTNINMTVTNTTQGRVYVIDVSVEQSQYGQLGNGDRLSFPQVSGISICPSIYLCMQSSMYQNLSSFSYIEPGDTLSFSFSYYTNNKAEPDDTISFSPTFMVRSVQPNGNPDKPSPMKAVRFSFNSVPIGC